MRFLHLCDQNWSVTANAFVEAHRRHGHEAHLVTLVRCVNEFEEEICLHLPLLQGHAGHRALKYVMDSLHGNRPKFVLSPSDGVPIWEPRGPFERAFHRFREEVLWKPRIERAIAEHHLDRFDVYNLQAGIGFYRDARFLRRMKARGAHVVCWYLGTDLRERGAIPAIREISDLDLTCEWDHLALDPSLELFFLPFDASQYEYREPAVDTLRVCHAPRNRFLKGTEGVLRAVEEARREVAIEFDLIEGATHDEAIRRKRRANLIVDHLGSAESITGYGANSLEAFAMGICSATSMTPGYEKALGDHPFYVVTADNLASTLKGVARDLPSLRARARRGRQWVERVHGVDGIVEDHYERYRRRGWMDDDGNAIRRRDR